MADMEAFREAVTAWAAGGPGDPARELAEQLPVRTAVLLEGPSDAAAVNALAESRGRDLAAEGVCVLPMGCAMSVARFAGLLGPPDWASASRASATSGSAASTSGGGSGPVRGRSRSSSSAWPTWRRSSSAPWA